MKLKDCYLVGQFSLGRSILHLTIHRLHQRSNKLNLTFHLLFYIVTVYSLNQDSRYRSFIVLIGATRTSPAVLPVPPLQ